MVSIADGNERAGNSSLLGLLTGGGELLSLEGGFLDDEAASSSLKAAAESESE